MPLTLLELPEEIISVVFLYLAESDEERWDVRHRSHRACKADLASVSVVSSLMRRLSTPFLFESVIIKSEGNQNPFTSETDTVFRADFSLFDTYLADLVKHVVLSMSYRERHQSAFFIQGAIDMLHRSPNLETLRIKYLDSFTGEDAFKVAISEHLNLKMLFTESLPYPLDPTLIYERPSNATKKYLSKICYSPEQSRQLYEHIGNGALSLAIGHGLKLLKLSIKDSAMARDWLSQDTHFLEHLEEIEIDDDCDAGVLAPLVLSFAQTHPKVSVKLWGPDHPLLLPLISSSPSQDVDKLAMASRYFALSIWKSVPITSISVDKLACVELRLFLRYRRSGNEDMINIICSLLKVAIKYVPTLQDLYIRSHSHISSSEMQSQQIFELLSRLPKIRRIQSFSTYFPFANLAERIYHLACKAHELEYITLMTARNTADQIRQAEFAVDREYDSRKVRGVYGVSGPGKIDVTLPSWPPEPR